MQTQGGVPAAAAIEATGTKRYFRREVLVDWNRDGLFNHPLSDISNLCSEITLDRQLTGTAPSEILLVEGHAAAELTLTLEGERDGLSVVELFSTYNGNSPLYTVDQIGCEITYRIGVDIPGGLPAGTLTDTFSRVTSNGWGVSDSGHTWTHPSTTVSDLSTNGTKGLDAASGVDIYRRCEPSISPQVVDFDLRFTIAIDKTATDDWTVAGVTFRHTDDDNRYFARIEFRHSPANTVFATLYRETATVVTVLDSVQFGTYTAGEVFGYRLSAQGPHLKFKIWRNSGAEPADWTVEATDTTHTSGHTIIMSAVGLNSTSTLPVTFTFDDLSIVYEGTDTIWYPQFVGNVRNPAVKRTRDAQVTMTALDRSEKMRQPVRLPVWAMTSWHSIRGYIRAQLCSAHWVIDQCLRVADASVTPYRYVTPTEGSVLPGNTHWGMQLWVSGNSGYIPNVGTIDNARVLGFPKTEVGGAAMYTRLGEAHPDVKTEVEATLRRPYNFSATTTDSTGVVPALEASDGTDRRKSFYLAYRAARPDELQEDKDGCHLFGFTLITRGDGDYWQTTNVAHMEVYVGHLHVCRIRTNGGGLVRAELYRWDTDTVVASTPYIAIPTGQDSVQIEAQFSGLFGSARRAGIRAGTTVGTYTNIGSYAGSFDYDTREGLAIIRHQVGMQDVYWTCRATSLGDFVTSRFETYARREATYPGVLDEGLNKLTLMPSSSYDDAWELASAVAAAEMGAIFWDEVGVFRFWNRNTIAAKQTTVVRTITTSMFEQLGLANSLDSLRNIVTADQLLATSDQAMIFESSNNEEFYIPSATEVQRSLPASNDVMAVQPGFVTRYSSTAGSFPVWNDNVQHGYVVQWYVAGAWLEHDERVSGVDILAYSDGQGNTELNIWNGYGEPARFSSNAGNARLRITGTAVARSDNVVSTWRDQASVDKYGDRNLPLSGDWVQNQPASIQQLGQFMLDRTVQSIPVIEDITIPGDPRLQLADCVDVLDPHGIGEQLKLQILGFKRVFSIGDGLTDHLSVELIRPSLLGIWDSPQYGRWDETLIWS